MTRRRPSARLTLLTGAAAGVLCSRSGGGGGGRGSGVKDCVSKASPQQQCRSFLSNGNR